MQNKVFRASFVSLVVALVLGWVTSPRAQSNIILNGSVTDPAIIPAFLFEPEVPLASLKGVPTWNELEQLLDNPYRTTAVCTDSHGQVPGNDQGFPSRCSTITRRPSFGGVTLPPLIVNPLNYNPTSGEEMRMLNPNFQQTDWTFQTLDPNPQIVDVCPTTPPLVTKTLTISSGSERVQERAIDYNSPFVADPIACIPNVEVPEVGFLLGGDPGEPDGYSLAAVNSSGQLIDPATGGVIVPRDTSGNGGLNKPSLKVPRPELIIPVVGGSPNGVAFYTANGNNVVPQDDSDTQIPSNENDYVKDRTRAMQLGKALFWDMQVGSDGVQSCGSCHFHAGADNRTKNQINPNHIGGDVSFQVRQPNEELVASDFPFVKLANPEIAGDPKCVSPISARVNAGVLENNPNGVDRIVCSAGNALRISNDVASSMGVKFGRFRDIQLGFVTNASGVNVVRTDLRSTNPTDNIDPIPGFAGNDGSGHQFRRVEPRNTPTLFAAAFNFDNFWDGRARHDFNGGSVFGAADPQGHVWVNAGGTLTPTRQIIRFASLASLATGPALSEFEMSFAGRNWAKIAKRLLQGTVAPSTNSVTPLANQLVDTTDSLLGPLSNQGGSECASLGRPTAVGKPGLCTTYQEMIQRAFFNNLWNLNNWHVEGCYTDGATALHPNQCGAGSVAIPVLSSGQVVNSNGDPFDSYVLQGEVSPDGSIRGFFGAPVAANTNQFSQMQANFSLFFGLGVHLWTTILVPDNTPFDQFLDQNPDAFANLGEPGEAGLVGPQPMCTNPNQRFCVTEVGNFKRDANLNCNGLPAGGEGGGTVNIPNCQGTRRPGDPDPLLGLDLFFASNMSLKNPNFRSARCGECHAPPTLTDNTVPFTFKAQLRDFVSEFAPGAPGIEFPIEPLGRLRVISGFLLESEMNENGQDGVERRIANQSIAPNPVDGLAYPDGIFNPEGGFIGAGSGYFDNGVYNIGVTPCEADQVGVTGQCDDISRGGTDAFGWPLSLAALMLKNLGGPGFEPGVPLPNFNPSADPDCAPECATGGLFEESSQDQQINPGFEGDDIITPMLPSYLAPFANAINVGDSQPELDEIFSGLNTLTDTAMIEGFLDTLGPFNPAGTLNEATNVGDSALMGSWPFVNRVSRMGSFKAPQLREVELTGPYFHNGGKLTLRQVVDFYSRGGDFPITNANHRDFNIVNLGIEVQSNLTEEEKVALVDLLLEFTDDRVAFERAPFDHPEVFVPLDGTAPENTFGRPGFLTNIANGMFRQVRHVGSAGVSTRLPSFLGLSNTRLVGPAAFCGDSPTSHYCR